ncbi:hypothetical protein BKA60DRAFT_549935 [Fusarium oxysporum]|nr:hypothetical protein BKA60DRAFT_549935 [Fusarium oxysporum]
MCFYDQSLWACGYWRWDGFRQRCPKVHRIGETCGLKFIFETSRISTPCKICSNISIKQRRIDRLLGKMPRLRQFHLIATRERYEKEVADIRDDIRRLTQRHLIQATCGAQYVSH